MFGELIGLWVASVWQQMGSPENVHFIELGPGRGTLMADALRAAKVVPRFSIADHDASRRDQPGAAGIQQRKLESLGEPVSWHASLDDVPAGPAIIVANEFFDALPSTRRSTRPTAGMSAVVESTTTASSLSASPPTRSRISNRRCRGLLRHAPAGAVFEWRSDHLALELGRRDPRAAARR